MASINCRALPDQVLVFAQVAPLARRTGDDAVQDQVRGRPLRRRRHGCRHRQRTATAASPGAQPVPAPEAIRKQSKTLARRLGRGWRWRQPPGRRCRFLWRLRLAPLVGTTFCCPPGHQTHSVPELAAPCTASCAGACRIIHHIVCQCLLLSSTKSYDVASNSCQAVPRGSRYHWAMWRRRQAPARRRAARLAPTSAAALGAPPTTRRAPRSRGCRRLRRRPTAV